MKNGESDNPGLDRGLLPPDWLHAINVLQGVERAGLGWKYIGRHDVRPLAKMLRSGQDVPASVARVIADHLDRPPKRQGGRFVYEPPKKKASDPGKSLFRRQQAAREYRSRVDGGEAEKVVRAQVAKKYRLGEGTVKSLKVMTEDELMKKASLLLDPSTLLP